MAEAAALSAGPFGDLRVGLVHGRLKAAEKHRVMDDFAAGRLDVLVATTVVEAGIDVPAAAWMVIHGAERFGLAQLHQLRGRIGRGGGPSWCWLIPSGDVAGETRQRLAFFAAHSDGFALAEEDLRLRGPGDLWASGSTARLASGWPTLADADPAALAVRDGRALLGEDPQLRSSLWRPLRERLLAQYGKLVPLAAG
ncbi:MAG: helicase-related protein [Candidatus Krumholzibacteriia bacterium]